LTKNSTFELELVVLVLTRGIIMNTATQNTPQDPAERLLREAMNPNTPFSAQRAAGMGLLRALRRYECAAVDETDKVDYLLNLIRETKPENFRALLDACNAAGSGYFQGIPQDPEERAEKLRREAYSLLRQVYYTEVNELAEWFIEEIREGNYETFDDFMVGLQEHIDGCQRVIYTHLAREVMLVSDNAGAYSEVYEGFPMNGGDPNWAAIAYMALEQDLIQAFDQRGFQMDENGFDVLRTQHTTEGCDCLDGSEPSECPECEKLWGDCYGSKCPDCEVKLECYVI
jgi:hypothetical protein